MNSPSASSPSAARVRLGGALGIAGSIIGLLIFVVACAGFDGAFLFSMLPVAMGAVGLIIAFTAALQQKSLVIEDTHVTASFFVNFIAIVGGLLEMAIWLKWPIFYPAAS
jgi:hypothetical protein